MSSQKEEQKVLTKTNTKFIKFPKHFSEFEFFASKTSEVGKWNSVASLVWMRLLLLLLVYRFAISIIRGSGAFPMIHGIGVQMTKNALGPVIKSKR